MKNHFRFSLLLLILFLIYSKSFSGNISTGIGIGKSYSMLAPYLSYDFNFGVGVDISLMYISPNIDYTAGIKYLFAIRDNFRIGPKLTIGKRDNKIFESKFVGISTDIKIFFTQNNFLEFQIGIERNDSEFKRTISMPEISPILPHMGFSYGYSFGKEPIKFKSSANNRLSNVNKILLTAGQASGVLLGVSGLILGGFGVHELGTFSHGIPEGMCYLGGSSFCLGTMSFLICSKIKDKYEHE